MRNDLQARFANWKDPVINRIVSEVEIDSIYPVWTTPDLPTWTAGSVVLIGDAAHALPSSSGQGISQALEDLQAFSMLLAKHFSQDDDHTENLQEAIEMASKSYCQVRMPRVKRIADHGRKLGDMKREKGFIAEYLLYFILWIMGWYLNHPL